MKHVIYTIVTIYSIAIWLSFSNILLEGSLSGDLKGIEISINDYELFFLAVIQQVILLMIMPLYKYLHNKKIIYSSIYVEINAKLFDRFIFLLIIINLFFLLITGVGKVLSQNTHFLSPFFAVITPSAIFYLYYVLFREKLTKFFVINVLLFIILELLKGWTGFFLVIFFLELYFYIKRNKLEGKVPALGFGLISGLCIILIGSFFYKYAFLLKNEIRGIVVTNDLTYIDALSLFTERLTNFDVTVGIYTKFENIIRLSSIEAYFSESKSFFRPLVLQSMMDKDFNSLNNYVLYVFYPVEKINSSVDISIFMYYLLLFNINVFDALFVILLTVISFFIMVSIYRIISNNSYDVNILIFLLLLQLVNTSSVEVVFSHGKLLIIFVVVLLWAFKVIKIKKRCE